MIRDRAFSNVLVYSYETTLHPVIGSLVEYPSTYSRLGRSEFAESQSLQCILRISPWRVGNHEVVLPADTMYNYKRHNFINRFWWQIEKHYATQQFEYLVTKTKNINLLWLYCHTFSLTDFLKYNISMIILKYCC